MPQNNLIRLLDDSSPRDEGDCPAGIWHSLRTCTRPSVCHATQCVMLSALGAIIVLVLVTVLKA